MCRMVGFSFKTNRQMDVLFRHLQHMAQFGKNAPHGHGWGIYALKDEAVIYHRSLKPAYEDEIVPLKASVGILHARKASEHLPVSFLQLHPFIDNRAKAFCHNGTIYDIPFVSIESDTFAYFMKIKDFLTYDELVQKVRSVADRYKHTGMNFLMVNDRELIVYCGYSENEDYYTLWYSDEDGFVVASEPLNETFKPMGNRTMFVVKDGVIEKILKV
ncbi:MAG: class II glutamine amidotransferase [Thermotoga caldifontis]|uniref:class II glutamine amidotransferase n=1 Tax=Thermotoga caldifontis TaxID=1508419 RepID=UPI003C79C14E